MDAWIHANTVIQAEHEVRPRLLEVQVTELRHVVETWTTAFRTHQTKIARDQTAAATAEADTNQILLLLHGPRGGQE